MLLNCAELHDWFVFTGDVWSVGVRRGSCWVMVDLVFKCRRLAGLTILLARQPNCVGGHVPTALPEPVDHELLLASKKYFAIVDSNHQFIS